MNRLGKILTLGLERKRAWQLPIIGVLLLMFGLGIRWFANHNAVRVMNLVGSIDIGDVEAVRYILKWGPDQAERSREIVETAPGYRDEGKLVVKPSTKKFQYLPLGLAIKRNRPEIATLLIKHGVKVNIPLRVRAGEKPEVRFYAWHLRVKGAADPPQFWAWQEKFRYSEWRKKNRQVVIRVSARTPLYYETRRGHTQVVRLLIEAGADVNLGNSEGRTPLHNAVSGGHCEIVKLLIAAGANLNARAKNVITPLHSAIWGGHLAAAKLLVEAGAKVGPYDWFRRTRLLYASESGQFEVARMLLDAGADVNTIDRSGRTPLDWAINGKREAIVEFLKKHGAKTGKELPENKGGTPSMAAETKRQ